MGAEGWILLGSPEPALVPRSPTAEPAEQCSSTHADEPGSCECQGANPGEGELIHAAVPSLCADSTQGLPFERQTASP